jgi:hypothetical protein
MLLVQTQQRTGADSEKILGFTYVWVNRLIWPAAAVISGLTAYWTFMLPHSNLLVQAGGGVFGLFGIVCALNALLWWSSDGRNPPSSS